MALSVGLLLAYIHRDDLFPPAEEAATEDPFALCIAQREAEIDGMVADGVVDAGRAALFKSRAEALCRSEGPAR